MRASAERIVRGWSRPSLADFTGKRWDELDDAERKAIGEHFLWAPADARSFDDLKLPYRGPGGAVNIAAVRNALARLDQTKGIPASGKAAIRARLEQMLNEHRDKGDMTVGDVHVAGPIGAQQPPKQRRTFKIAASDDEKQIIYGVVMEPDAVDTQGDFTRAGEIEVACWRFLIAYHQRASKLRLMHRRDLSDQQALLVENYIAPQDVSIGGQPVRKGTWLQAWYIADPRLWADVKRGIFTGFSIGADVKAYSVPGADVSTA